MKNKFALLGRLAIFSTAIIWGTSFIVLKSALDSIGTMWVLAIRFTVSALLMFLFAAKKIRSMSLRAVKGSTLMGLALAAAYIFQTYGLVYTTPGKNAFLTATYCVLVPFLAWAVYKRKPGIANLIAAVVCVVGIGFVSLESGMGQINFGDILTLICGLFYSAQIIMMEQYSDSSDALCISTVQFLAAAIVCWLGALAFESAPADVSGEAWLMILYLSVMCTAVCFFLQAWGMKYTPSSTAAMLMTLEAVFGALFSVLLYGEKLSIRTFSGFVLIFAAVLMSEVFSGKINQLFARKAT